MKNGLYYEFKWSDGREVFPIEDYQTDFDAISAGIIKDCMVTRVSYKNDCKVNQMTLYDPYEPDDPFDDFTELLEEALVEG